MYSSSASLLIVLAAVGFADLASAASCSKGRSHNDQRCCVWFDILDEVQSDLFDNGSCDEVAHDALRLTFHDAVGYSKSASGWRGGGADGSIIKFKDTEMADHGNAGLDEIIEAEQVIAQKYPGVSYGDFIQFAGAVSVGNCAGGPKIPFLAGRADATAPAPPGTLPDAADSVDVILKRMDDAGFTPEELVALLASHSIAMQEQVDPSIPFTPLDSTPEVLDSQFYLDVLLKGTAYPGNGPHTAAESLSPIPGEFRLQSDMALARDRRTSCEWQKLMFDEALMKARFAAAMDKLAVVGYKRTALYDCSSVIPAPKYRVPQLPKLPPGKKITDLEFSCPPFNLIKALPSIISTLPGLSITSGPVVKLPAFDRGHSRLQTLAQRARAALNLLGL